jgi:hypothetical protein
MFFSNHVYTYQVIYLDRIGMENDPLNNLELERELDLRRIQVR